jgi:hypothetical protein
MASSVNRLILIGAAVAIVGVAGYFIYINLTENSPLGQLARSRLGLDTRPGAGILQDPRVSSYKADPRLGGYVNKTKSIIEDPKQPQSVKDLFKDFEKLRAEKYFGKANAGFAFDPSIEEELEPWAHR